MTVMLQDGEKEDLPEIPFSVDLEDWNYVLVNEKNPLQQDFEVDLAKTDNGKYVDRRIQKALETMLVDGKKEGLPLMVCSAYRDYQKQDQLMDNSIAKFVRGGIGSTVNGCRLVKCSWNCIDSPPGCAPRKRRADR